MASLGGFSSSPALLSHSGTLLVDQLKLRGTPRSETNRDGVNRDKRAESESNEEKKDVNAATLSHQAIESL